MKDFRTIAATLALLCACASQPDSDTAGGPTGHEGPAPGSSRNGAIAFARVDPRDAVVEGARPVADLVLRTSKGRETVIAAAFPATPAWSPDGSQLAFLGQGGLWVVAPPEEPTMLSRCDPSSCDGYGPPAWSPDGGTIAFGASREGTDGLWSVTLDGGEPTLVAGDLLVQGNPSWSLDGSAIAVVATPLTGGERAVMLIDAGSGRTTTTLRPPGLSVGQTVAWSPDGTQLLVTSDGGAEGEGIFLLRPDGSEPRLVTSCPGPSCIDLWPGWSPDGRQVVFTRGRCDELGSDCTAGDLFRIPIGGGRRERLTEGSSLECCAAWRAIRSA